MKKLVILFVLVGTIFLFTLNKDQNQSSVVKSKIYKKSDKLAASINPRQSLKKSKYVIPVPAKSRNTFPEECSSSLRDLTVMTAEEYKEFIRGRESLISFFKEGCLNKLKTNPAFQNIVKVSRCKILEEQKEVEESPCLTMMFILKAYFIVDHTAHKTPSEMTSQELAANVVKMFFDIEQLSKEKFLDNLKLVNTLYEMHPNDPDVLEAYLGYMMLGKQVTNENSVSLKINDLMTMALGESFKVDRLYVLKDILKNDLSSVKQSLDKLNTLYPKESELAYYYAAYYWKYGNREEANAYLDKAIKLGESCSYCIPELYVETKKKLSAAKTKDDKIFSISIGLNFENL